MPELPEVEVVRRGLDDHVRGRTIASAVIRHPRAARRHTAGPDDLAARMVGATITGTARRGKYLWLILDDRDALLMHLGMSGQMLITSPDAAIAPHERARFTFTDGGADLRFDDQRTFGHLMFDEGGAVLPSPIAHIARDPFDPKFDQATAVARIKTRPAGIKRAIDAARPRSSISTLCPASRSICSSTDSHGFAYSAMVLPGKENQPAPCGNGLIVMTRA